MKALVMSDLHLELASVFWEDWGPFYMNLAAKIEEKSRECDLLILPGDILAIGTLFDQKTGSARSGLELILPLVDQIVRSFKKTIYVPGNHEFWDILRQSPPSSKYTHSWLDLFQRAFGRYDWLKPYPTPRLEILHAAHPMTSFGGLHITGSTWWTRLDPLQQLAAPMIIENEFSNPGHNGVWWNDAHSVDQLAMMAALDPLNEELWNKKHIIVTHMPPLALSRDVRRGRSVGTDPFYYNSEADFLKIANGLRGFWMHGHTHGSCNYNYAGFRVLCKPFGYLPLDENPGNRNIDDYLRRSVVDLGIQ